MQLAYKQTAIPGEAPATDPMQRKRPTVRPVPPISPSAFEQAWSGLRDPKTPPPTVSGRWLLMAASWALLAALACAWLTLCLLFWQGSWQLLYHPTAAVARTPASVGLAFDPVAFATTDAGEARLKGWWIPAATDAGYRRYTVLYLHGENGNLGDTVGNLSMLHSVGVNILAFDYRGYGQSQFVHPSEARGREDAGWALDYLTATRHIAPGSILLDGRELGANLALEVAAAHPELAGVVLESPVPSPVDAIFNDPRSRLVPAHLLVRDRYDVDQAAAALRVPSLWLTQQALRASVAEKAYSPVGYNRVTANKTLVWLVPSHEIDEHFVEAYRRWIDDLPRKSGNPTLQ